MIEFELSGVSYRAEKLDAMKQFHVTRKLAPVIPALLPLFASATKGDLEKALNGGDTAELAKAAEPLAKALADMSDEHADYVVNACMLVVSRHQGDKWARVWANGVSMFDDMGLEVILPLVVRVLRENLGGFMAGMATKATAIPNTP